MLDEVNIMINAIHTKTVEKHREIPIPISDKTDWTNMFDDLMFHKHVIVIMTSNQSKEEIDALDRAYLRTGRIDATFSMLSPINTPSEI
jgi:ATP-dependent 26S proteasome regulatory subunit